MPPGDEVATVAVASWLDLRALEFEGVDHVVVVGVEQLERLLQLRELVVRQLEARRALPRLGREAHLLGALQQGRAAHPVANERSV